MNSLIRYLLYCDYYRWTGGKTLTTREIIRIFRDSAINVHGFKFLVIFRNYQYYYTRGIRSNYILYRFWRSKYHRISKILGVDIPITVKIGKGCILYHPNGIVIHPNAVIGDNCSILQQVTIGNTGKELDKVAVIGDCCSLGAGAKIIGPVKIGNNSSVGAGAVVTHDVPDNCSVGGVPARVINSNLKPQNKYTDYLCFEKWNLKSGGNNDKF